MDSVEEPRTHGRRKFLFMGLGALAATQLPIPEPQRLLFHRDAFAMAMRPLKLDILYGCATIRPDLAARLVDDLSEVEDAYTTESGIHVMVKKAKA